MKHSSIFTFCALCLLNVPSSRSIEDGVLMKNISDLHFQLFSSIQKKTKMIKTAVFETQCSGSGCTFNGCESSGSDTCDGQMFQKLNKIQSSISKMWKKNPVSVVCKRGAKRYNGHCYYFFKTKLNWFEAQAYCRNQGFSLLEITDANEDNWVSRTFPKVPYWIDYTDIGKEGKWVSLSTGKGIYHSRTFKPDNARGNQDCAFNNFGLRQGHWDDTYCTDKLNVICETSRSDS